MQNGSVTAILNGTLGLNKTTAGTVTLSGADIYTGTTSVSAGTLALGGNNGVPAGSNLTVSGGNFNIGTFNDTVAGVQLTGGAISGTTGILTSSSAYDMENGAVTAILNGTVGLNKTTGGTVTLAGPSTYTGTTSVSAGTLLLAGVNGVPSTSNLTVSSGTFDVSSFNDTVAGVQLTGGLINGTTGILTSLSAFDMENGNVTAILNGTVGLNKTTTGTITLSGLNTYTGNTSVSAGILAVGATNSVPSTSNVTVSGGNFSISLFNDTVAGVQLTGGTINGTTGTWRA